MNTKRIGIGLLGIALSGCVVTTTTQVVEMERVDQELSGNVNRGYLRGNPPQEEVKPRKTTRQVIRTDVELPTLAELQRAPSKDEELNGNKGYLLSQQQLENQGLQFFSDEPETAANEAELTPLESPETDFAQEAIGELEPVMQAKQEELTEPIFEEYIVQKGDTLQSIAAKPNVYGKSSQWVKLYRANKGILSSPDKIYPGMKIKIPKN